MNTILARSALQGERMADTYGPGTGTPDYPAYRFHLSAPMRLVKTVEEDERARSDGYRDHPYTEEEKQAHADRGAIQKQPDPPRGEGAVQGQRR